MLVSGTRPPIGVKLSCQALIAPQEASVVSVANREESTMPKRTSFPSILPPGWKGPLVLAAVIKCALPAIRALPFCSAITAVKKPREKRMNMAAQMDQPCLVFPTHLPNM